ncbi:MAG: helix-turn-helix domain-containing protein [Phormidesmis sp.]
MAVAYRGHTILTEDFKAPVDPAQCLKALMQRAKVSSYRALATQSGVSRWQIQQLRSGNIAQMRLGVVAQLAAALEIPLNTLLSEFGLTNTHQTASASNSVAQSQQLIALQKEYQRLQEQMAQQVALARSQTQIDALQKLESWLVQWPTIAKRAQEREELPAAKLLPFIRPVEQLMAEWGVEAIAPVDATLPYDPQYHQLIGGTAEPGALVRVTHSGHQYQGKLLHRAKVKLENLS